MKPHFQQEFNGLLFTKKFSNLDETLTKSNRFEILDRLPETGCCQNGLRIAGQSRR
jgi:hypothetical protein